jgi:NAD(P)-dependent dehydrogenase (short-subunit alcohol dehydrogenase family)
LPIDAAVRSCLVTGASTGIGEACARRLDGDGWRVFAGVRRPQDGERLRETIGPRIRPVALDVTDGASIAEAARAVRQEVGGAGLSGLVNNAGIAVSGPLEFLPLDDLRHQLEVNVVGQVAVTQAMLPMLREGDGRIVFMGSIAGRMAMPFLGPYAASKFALEALTDSLRVELQPWGLHVAIVEPGSIATPIWAKSKAAVDGLTARLPPDAGQRYGAAMGALIKIAASAANRGIPADVVAQAVAHALTSDRPRTRYVIGTDARIRARVAPFLPDRLRDLLITRITGIPKRDDYRKGR